jgi:hypothetical protein
MRLTICGRWIVDEVDDREDLTGAIGDFPGRDVEGLLGKACNQSDLYHPVSLQVPLV